MNKIKLLDCTLRDGGYLNDWEFGYETIINIYQRLVSSRVEVIEVGFINDTREFDQNRCIMPDTNSVNRMFGHMEKGQSQVVGMIDYGTCDLANVQPCADCYLDGIRVIFKEEVLEEALEYCRAIKSLGYEVYVQLVSVTSYTSERLQELIVLVNEFEPYAVSMVDTYGLLHQENLVEILERLDRDLLPSIALGYHAHNNFQMGYANGISVLASKVNRTLLIDGTLYGMGKSAGNTPLELLGMHLNECYGKSYDIGQMLEAIDTSILEIQRTVQWGYNLFYYIAASTKCHPNYVSFFMNKRTLSMKAINELLLTIDEDKKLLYDQKHAEAQYLAYQKHACNDEQDRKHLQERLQGKSILVLGPGNTMKEQTEMVEACAAEAEIIIAINYIPIEYEVDYMFLTNAKRYVQMGDEGRSSNGKTVEVIATSNVVKTQGKFPYTLNYERLIDESTDIPDNSFVMLLKVLMEAEVSKVYLAGFDGYSETKMNYFNTNMEYSFAKDKAHYLNEYVSAFLTNEARELSYEFVTDTCYELTM
ncbi:MAG: aldolase catalytic domain-containing protein [Eubacteriales bacterium]